MCGVEAFISIGRIVRPHGLGGEIKVVSLTHRSEWFKKYQNFCVGKGGMCKEWVEVERESVEGNHVILKLKGIDNRTAAEAFCGSFLYVRRESYPALPEGKEYLFNLIGLNVETTEGQRVGSLIDVLELPGQYVYVVDTGEKEVLIPVVKEFIQKVDIQRRIVFVRRVEGLLD